MRRGEVVLPIDDAASLAAESAKLIDIPESDALKKP
jgi:hypothetical protein